MVSGSGELGAQLSKSRSGVNSLATLVFEDMEKLAGLTQGARICENPGLASRNFDFWKQHFLILPCSLFYWLNCIAVHIKYE